MKTDKPLVLPIAEIITESERVKSFVFEYDFPGEPGQFVMTWIPGFDEKPFGIVKKEKNKFMITVAAVGQSTKALHEMKVGDKLGFRGPYGTSFKLPDQGVVALVAGGYGIAPLAYLAAEARKKNLTVHLFLGARTKDDLVFVDWMEKISVTLHLSTDDGSAGYKGYNTDLFKEKLAEIEPTKVFIVGPEIMELKVVQVCNDHNISFQVSIERYMKCGFGLCGQCCVDPTGWRMCVEGPVLNQDQLKKVQEFGKYHRTASGRIVNH